MRAVAIRRVFNIVILLHDASLKIILSVSRFSHTAQDCAVPFATEIDPGGFFITRASVIAKRTEGGARAANSSAASASALSKSAKEITCE
jgi:hypothetical protein